MSCLQPSGYITDGTDCDDNDPDTSPIGTEVCDNIDNDCNGVIDDSTAIDALPWYWDGDGDQYGDGPVAYSCTQPPSHAPTNGDCDDSLNTVYPNAPELCDSIDNDCDGVVDDGCLKQRIVPSRIARKSLVNPMPPTGLLDPGFVWDEHGWW